MSEAPQRVHIFGIRHHGPGSARSLNAALENLHPDILLIEGPPDANDLLPLVLSEAMHPPVALLVYAPDEPTYAAYYPFAIYSPEWQAMRWGAANNIPVRMMDLSQAIQMAIGRGAQAENQPAQPAESPPDEGSQPESPPTLEDANDPGPPPAAEPVETQPPFNLADPMYMLAEAAGYGDSEQWWEHLVEQRQSPAGLFTAILEAMTALREAAPPDTDPISVRREAAMRQAIRAALAEDYQRIAVVCGAWHSPSLAHLEDPADEDSADRALLAGLPHMAVRATWVPWTNARLTRQSGYGAGINSPGWYGHLWENTERTDTDNSIVTLWLIRVARFLRAEDLDISPAHIIEAVRLAEALAALRGRPMPGLDELNEAALTTFCFGNPLPMRLIEEKLIVGDTLGSVPPETPMAPLQQDFERETRRLRLPPEASERLADLDLRRPLDLERSYLLHRLNLLEIPWGRAGSATLQAASSGRGGTFHEVWRLKWLPEYAVLLIEAGQWGSTLAAAAAAHVCQAADRAPDLTTLTGMVEDVLLADLPSAIQHVMNCLQAQAAVSSDLRHLMQSFPSLANVLRYGNVRQTGTAMLAEVVEGLAARVCIGLPAACAALNDDAAAEMFDQIIKMEDAFNRLANEDYRQDWQRALAHLIGLPNIHGLLAGRACRILYDANRLPAAEAARRLSLALSTANDPLQAAAWIEGFLRGSGQLLVHDDGLLGILNNWLAGLSEPAFTQLLPLLRRTFATFAYPERRSIGERVKRSQPLPGAPILAWDAPTPDFDAARAATVLPLLAQLLGISQRPTP